MEERLPVPFVPEPSTPLGEAMQSMHEVYLEAVKAGFTPGQAMMIVVAALNMPK